MDNGSAYYYNSGGRWQRLVRRSVLLPVVGLLALGASGWVVLSIANNRGDRESGVESAIRAADTAFQSGNYQQSYDELASVLGQAKTKEEKVALYTSLAAAASSAGKVADAVEYLQKKHGLAPETALEDAYLLGTYYERQGNTAKAVYQYKKALGYYRSLPQSSMTRATIQNLEARIGSLGG